MDPNFCSSSITAPCSKNKLATIQSVSHQRLVQVQFLGFWNKQYFSPLEQFLMTLMAWGESNMSMCYITCVYELCLPWPRRASPTLWKVQFKIILMVNHRVILNVWVLKNLFLHLFSHTEFSHLPVLNSSSRTWSRAPTSLTIDCTMTWLTVPYML